MIPGNKTPVINCEFLEGGKYNIVIGFFDTDHKILYVMEEIGERIFI